MKQYRFEDGKYTIHRNDDGSLTGLRHGELWPGFEDNYKHSKLIGAMLDQIDDLEEVLDDKRRLTRELDVALNGPLAASQPALCDIVLQAEVFARDHGPAFAKRAAGSDVVVLHCKTPLKNYQLTMVEYVVERMNNDAAKRGSKVLFTLVGPDFDVHIAKSVEAANGNQEG